MKFSFGTRSKIKTKKTILFVCVENAGRSQMAEGFFRKYAPEGYESLSAGTKPVSQINPLAIQVMNEIGLDISKQNSKDLTEDSPTLFIPKVIDWVSKTRENRLNKSEKLEMK